MNESGGAGASDGVRRRHAARRALQISLTALAAGGVFLHQGWRRRHRGREGWLGAGAHAAVWLCHRLGATFIKVGQIASTRADLLPPPVIEELATLRDRVPPFPFAQVRRVVETSLGRPLEQVYRRFEPRPLAAASVAQVHEAVLRDGGARVAVKVRRPDVVGMAALDRAVLVRVGGWLERIVPTLRLVSLQGSLRHFCDAVEVQLHFGNEAAHNRRFRENFRGDPDVHFPEIHPAACSDAVLTMEFVEAWSEDQLETRGVDVHRVVETGMRCVCRMIFLHGFVHADLHPGNLRFYDSGAIALLDLGLVGELTEADRLTTARLLFAFATGDGRTVARLFYDNAPHTGTRDYARYEGEVAAFVERLRTRGLGNVQIALEIGRLFDILRRHRVQARSHMTMVNLALATAEGLGKRLAPDLSLAEEALPYLREALGAAVPAPAPAATLAGHE